MCWEPEIYPHNRVPQKGLVQVSKSVKYKRESRDSNIDKVDTPAMVRAHYKTAETLLSDVQKEYQ